MEIKATSRTKEARARRYREYVGLKLLPYRNKEQEGRYRWLCKERVRDNHAALAEGAR